MTDAAQEGRKLAQIQNTEPCSTILCNGTTTEQ